MSWALLARGANHNCVLAASKDILDIDADEELCDKLFIYPDGPVGIFLWSGSVQVIDENDIETMGHGTRIDIDKLDEYIGRNGEENI